MALLFLFTPRINKELIINNRSNNHCRGQPQDNVLLGGMGEGSGHQRQCYNCGKSGHLANVCPSKYKVATKMLNLQGATISLKEVEKIPVNDINDTKGLCGYRFMDFDILSAVF